MNVRITVASLCLALSLGTAAVPMAQAAVHPDPINFPNLNAAAHPDPGCPNCIAQSVKSARSLSRPRRVHAEYGQFGGPPFVTAGRQQM
jgi:hypothetical protein